MDEVRKEKEIKKIVTAADVEGSADEAIADFYQKHPNAPRRLPIPAQHFRPIFQHTEPDRSNGWSGRPTLRGG